MSFLSENGKYTFKTEANGDLEMKNAVGIISSKNGLNSILVIGEEKIGELKERSQQKYPAQRAKKRMGKYRNKHDIQERTGS